MRPMTRRAFLQTTAASAVTLSAFPKSAAAYGQLALFAAATVVSYLASKGNPTVALINANFQAIAAMNHNVKALNSGLQNVMTQIAELRARVLRIPKETVDELLHANLFGAWATILGNIQGELRNQELGITIDRHAKYRQVKESYGTFINARNTLIAHSRNHNFSGILHVCVAWTFELDCLSYLIESGMALDLGELNVGDLDVATDAYVSYLRDALDPRVPNSLPKALVEAIRLREESRATFEHLPPMGGTYTLGCQFLQRDLVAARRAHPGEYVLPYRRKALAVEQRPSFHGAQEYKASAIDADSITVSLGRDLAVTRGGRPFMHRWYTSMPEECKVVTDRHLDEKAFLRMRDDFNERVPAYQAIETEILAIRLIIEAANQSVAGLECMKAVIAHDATCYTKNEE